MIPLEEPNSIRVSFVLAFDTIFEANTKLLAVTFAPVMLPVADTTPPVVILPPETLPVADTKPAVVKLAPETAPNEPDQVPEVIVPTEVREDKVATFV